MSPIVITLSVRPSVCLPSVRPSVCPSTLCCNAITQKSLNLQTSYFIHTITQIENSERNTPIDFRVKRLKVTWPLTYFWKTLTLAVTFLSKQVGLSYLASAFLMTRPFLRHINFEHVTLTVTFDLLLTNFIISRNFFILRDKAFIFGKCVP